MSETTALATPRTKERQKLYDAMPVPLQRAADAIEKKLGNAARGSVLLKYDVGIIIRDVIAGEAAHGQKAVEQLAAYNNIAPKNLYALRDWVSTFEKDFVQEWSGKPFADGSGYMTESHWLALRQIETEKGRLRMLDRVIRDGLTANQLEIEIKSGAGGKTKNVRTGGRKPSTPTSPLAGLQKFQGLAISLTNYSETVEQGVYEALENLEPADVTDTHLKRAQETLDAVTKAAEELAGDRDRLTKVVESVQAKLDEKKAAEAAATTAADGDGQAEAVEQKPAPKKAKKKDKAKKKKKAKRPAAAV